MNSPCKTTQNKAKQTEKEKDKKTKEKKIQIVRLKKKGNKPNSVFYYAVFTQHKIRLN